MENTREFISIKQTWQSSVKLILALIQDGNKEGRDTAIAELAKMAKAADMMVDRLEEEAVNPDATPDQILEEAQSAFWAVIAKNYPNVKTGDFSPEATTAFDDACMTAVTLWLAANTPITEPKY